jgi:hypothetical protein
MRTMTTKWADDHDEEDPPPRGKIHKYGQGKEEGLAFAKEVRCAAVQVHDSNAAFLLMAEARAATVTALLSTVASGVLLSLGTGTMTIIPGLLSPKHALDDDNVEEELAWELVGTQQQEQCRGTPSQLRQLLVWATFGLDFHH